MIANHNPRQCGGANICATCKAAVRASSRRFPIQAGYENEGPHPLSVPWRLAELAYPVYAAHGGRGQSLERLAERGGFGWDEFACFFSGHYPGRCQGERGGGDRTRCRATALRAVEQDVVAAERRRIALLVQDAASKAWPLGDIPRALLSIREAILALEDEP